MAFKHRLSGTLAALFFMVILFITSIEAIVYWIPGYFEHEYTKYQVLDSLPVMTMDDLLYVTDQMMDYLKGEREDLHIVTTLDGQEQEFFNEREIAHMEDVQVLFLEALSIRRVLCVLVLLLLVFIAATGGKLGRILPSCICLGTGIFFALTAALAAVFASNFTKYFVIFHRIFFDNDLWILDPDTDLLINIVPLGFFMDTAAYIALTFCLVAALLFIVCFFLARKNKTAAS